MTDRQTSIALHLARVMGLDVRMARFANTTSRGWYEVPCYGKSDVRYRPHHDRAQWAECVEWAAVSAAWAPFGIDGERSEVWYLDPKSLQGHAKRVVVDHDGTGEGVRAAALEAIALATGWPGMEGE